MNDGFLTVLNHTALLYIVDFKQNIANIFVDILFDNNNKL